MNFCQHLLDHQKKQESSRKTSTSALLTMPDSVDHNKLWEILQENGNTRSPYLPPEKSVCRSRTVRTGHGTTDWFQIRKGVHQGCILSPCLFNLYAEYIMQMLGWVKHKFESRFQREISITSNMQMTPPLWQKVKKN